MFECSKLGYLSIVPQAPVRVKRVEAGVLAYNCLPGGVPVGISTYAIYDYSSMAY